MRRAGSTVGEQEARSSSRRAAVSHAAVRRVWAGRAHGSSRSNAEAVLPTSRRGEPGRTIRRRAGQGWRSRVGASRGGTTRLYGPVCAARQVQRVKGAARQSLTLTSSFLAPLSFPPRSPPSLSLAARTAFAFMPRSLTSSMSGSFTARRSARACRTPGTGRCSSSRSPSTSPTRTP